jgi:rod shape-determining protein MreD
MRYIVTAIVSGCAIFMLVLFDVVAVRPFALTIPMAHIVLVVSVFLVMFVGRDAALTVAVIGGMLLDVMTLSYGVHTIPLVLVTLLIHALLLRFFTNKSLWTLMVLGGVATIIDYTIRAIATSSYDAFVVRMAIMLLVHWGLFTVFYWSMRLFSSNLTPYIMRR